MRNDNDPPLPFLNIEIISPTFNTIFKPSIYEGPEVFAVTHPPGLFRPLSCFPPFTRIGVIGADVVFGPVCILCLCVLGFGNLQNFSVLASKSTLVRVQLLLASTTRMAYQYRNPYNVILIKISPRTTRLKLRC